MHALLFRENYLYNQEGGYYKNLRFKVVTSNWFVLNILRGLIS